MASPSLAAFGTSGNIHHGLIVMLSLCLACIPTRCYAFHQQYHTFTTSPRLPRSMRESSAIHSTAISSADMLQIRDSSNDAHEDQNENNSNDNGGVEIWLDLRDTSLTPRTALELWQLEEQGFQQQQQEDNQKMETPPFVKCLISSNQKSRASTTQNNQQNIEVLIVAKNNDDGNGNDANAVIIQKGEESIGRIISLQASSSMPILPDPMPAMEAASNREWVVIDTNGWKKIDEGERTSMVLPLVELIATGASSSSSSSSSTGGIGLTCHTNNEVVKAAMFIQSLTSNGVGGNSGSGRTKTLESGIVVPDDGDDSLSGDAGNRMGARTNFALVLPFDMALLQTAKFLLGLNGNDATTSM